MMAKPATTKGQPRSERKGRPPRPDPPILSRPPPFATPETRRRRSLRSRRPHQILKDEDYGFDHEEEEYEDEEDEEEDEEEGRGLKKLRLVVKLHRSPVSMESTRLGRPRRPAVVPPASSSSSSPSPASSSSSYVGDEELDEEGDEEEQTVKPPKKRKIDVCSAVGGRSGHQEDRKKNVALYRSSGNSCSLTPSHGGTPLPERRELECILDKLQRKDTYGAFAEPVDLEDLPDYHDVIEHPMDFGTIRKKLARVAYRSFEQFEDDVFLICSNAMQYNAPDTVYFRQASAIQEMAQKKFQKIRDNMKSTEPEQRSEEKVISSMEKKMSEAQCTQQTQCKAVLEPLTSDISSGATLASAGDTCTRLSTVNSIEKSVAVNGVAEGSSSLGESKQDKGDDFSAKCSPSKLGRKSAPVDENRRTTYNITSDQEPIVESDLVLNLFEDEQKKLVPVEPEAEYSYARSLARYAVSLGPVAWEMVSKKIEQALPPGIKYGPGWVGEYEPLPRPFLSPENFKKQLTVNEISESRATTKDKATEVKSNVGQNPSSSKKQPDLKKQLIGGVPRKASISGESTSLRNSMEPKPIHPGVEGTLQLKSSGTGHHQKQSNDSSNLNSCFSNQMNNTNCNVARVRVKEESPSEETTERSQVVLCTNGKTQRSNEKALHQKKKIQEKKGSTVTKTLTKSSQQGLVNNPVSNGNHSNFPGIVSREGCDMENKNQKELPVASFQTQNNILGMAIGGSNSAIGPNNHFAFSSSNQTRVNHGLGLVNNRDHASIDPFRLVGFSGKVSNQENISTGGVIGTKYLEKSMPIVSPSTRDNYSSATSAAAKAWMSAGTGTTVQWKSVDGMSSSGEPFASPPFFNSTWKPTNTIQVNGDSMARPGNLPIQVFDEASHVRNRGLVIFPQLITTDSSKHQSHPPWQLLSPQPRTKQRDNLPPDLNIGYQPPTSPVQPSANMAMDSQQPDLALQL